LGLKCKDTTLRSPSDLALADTMNNVDRLLSASSILVALTAIAFLAAIVQLFTSLSGRSLFGRLQASTCNELTTGRWSRIGPLPTALPGAGLYLAMLVAGILNHPDFPLRVSARSAASLSFCALLAAGAAIWFISLQGLVLRKLCGRCMLVHLCGLAGAILALRQCPPAKGVFFTAATVLGVFVLLQVLLPSRLRRLESFSPAPTGLSPQASLPEAQNRYNLPMVPKFVRPNIAAMAGYTPGEQPGPGERVVKLNTNENPYPPSPKVMEALARIASDQLRRYPNPAADAFRAAAARLHGLDRNMILAGNGSDDVLSIIARTFLGPGDVLACPEPTYSL
jgi:uncharacterized membrane protein